MLECVQFAVCSVRWLCWCTLREVVEVAEDNVAVVLALVPVLLVLRRVVADVVAFSGLRGQQNRVRERRVHIEKVLEVVV